MATPTASLAISTIGGLAGSLFAEEFLPEVPKLTKEVQVDQATPDVADEVGDIQAQKRRRQTLLRAAGVAGEGETREVETPVGAPTAKKRTANDILAGFVGPSIKTLIGN